MNEPQVDVYAVCRAQLAGMEAQPQWQAWFAARSRFRHSPEVEATIVSQYGYLARDVASQASWHAMGYEAREGEVVGGPKAQKIWIEYANAPQGEARLESISALERVLLERGWQVHWEVGAKGEPAVICHADKSIHILPGTTPLTTLNRLGHEVGHVLLHDEGKGRATWEKEVEAQAFAFLLATGMGADISDYSCVYIFGWSEGRAIEDLAFGVQMRAALEVVEREMSAQMASERLDEPGV
jgi:hypothetical protein